MDSKYRRIHAPYNKTKKKGYQTMKRTSTFKVFLDFILVCLTGGLWLIWIIIRYFRSNSK